MSREGRGGMFDSQAPWRELFETLLDYEGSDCYSALLAPWLEQHPEECRWPGEFSRRTADDWAAATAEDRCELYAIFRVTSLLLLGFQEHADGSGYPGLAIDLQRYQQFHAALGFHVPEAREFHPFFHEIVGVEPAPSSGAPVTILHERWPPLMLGAMMFCRAGVVVSGGRAHVVKGVADRSRLYWTYRRNDRPCEDQSHGWGSNSQWRTGLRRDYRSPRGFHYNVDGRVSVNDLTGRVEGVEVSTIAELVRHRCLVTREADLSGLYPYEYSFTEAPGGE